MIIYDLEIIRGVLKRGENPEPGIIYCNGWKDFPGMGISVLCAYEVEDKRTHVFLHDNLSDFGRLLDKHDFHIGFNNQRFDNKVLEANRIHPDPTRCYDLLLEIWKAAGLGTEFIPAQHGKYSLDRVCQANELGSKTGSGADAPKLWQKRQFGKVIDYCLGDLVLTTRLFEKVQSSGVITCVRSGRSLLIRKPGVKEAATRLFDM